MCEDYEFMDSLEEILAVPGLNAVNFGPADYSMSTNTPSGYDMKAGSVDCVLDRLIACAVPKGIELMAPAVPPTRENIDRLVEKGVKMIICGSDIWHFQNALKTLTDDYLNRYRPNAARYR